MLAYLQEVDPSALAGQRLYEYMAQRAIQLALAEDLTAGDITSNAALTEQKIVTASVVFKEPGVIAGLNVFGKVMHTVDPNLQFVCQLNDGHRAIEVPIACATVCGDARSILAAERTALNFMQRLSGIATLTRAFVDMVDGSGIKILDTRKTTPGLRVFEKEAVVLGGGVNHRFGLSNAILIKDNHLQLTGSIIQAVEAVRKVYPNEPIEIETCTLEQVKQAAELAVATIMLDNMSPDMVRQAVNTINGRTKIEISGGINLANIRDYLIEGVDAISIGALTHSVKSIDISLEVEA